jgi:glycosyltransferase involved in cell wall biosynthesis
MNLGSYVKLNALNLLSINNSHQVYPLKDTISHPKSRFHVFFMRFFFRLSLRKADRALTQTEVMKGYVKSLSPRKDVSVFTKVVESSSDIRAVEPPKGVLKKLSEISNTFSMLYVATNYHHKNHKVIIEALALLVKESKSVTLILSLTEEEAVNIGGEVASSLIRTQHLCCVGWVDKSWLKYLYDFTSICLMPSILESLSSAHLEAMAWQVPQISADLPFARETCKEASLYCEPDNASCWSKRITCLIESSILYRDLQIKGLARVEEFPKDWHEVAKKYHTMFVDELNKKV